MHILITKTKGIRFNIIYFVIPCAGETRPFLVDQLDRLDFISLSAN